VEDRAHFRRHKGACPFYRENWINSGNVRDPEQREVVLYEIYCLQDTPPVTAEEQQRCLHSPRECWRLTAHRARARANRRSTSTTTAQPAP
jgi:hypothetical protein